ncbi:hypothetical protein AgCh_032738 [Apium graveolens]
MKHHLFILSLLLIVESKDASLKRGPKDKGPNHLYGPKMKNTNFKRRMQFKVNCFACENLRHAAKECATRYICLNREKFEDYDKAFDGEGVFMGNSSTLSILGNGKVSLKLTSRIFFALHNILHVYDIRRNLISGALLNKAGIKLTFKSDKLVFTKNGDFVGKGFCNGGLFVLDILTDNKIATASAYIAESVTLWHARLGHINVASVKRLKQLSLIPEFSTASFDKCEV